MTIPRRASLAALLAGILLTGTYAALRGHARTDRVAAGASSDEPEAFGSAALGDPRAQAEHHAAACTGCHAREGEAWRASQHAHALRPFDGRKDPPPPGAPHTPLAVIGVAPLEQVLLPGERGRVQVFDPAYDREHSSWFSVFGATPPRPEDWGHWSRGGMNWNAQCAACHTTALTKGYDAATDAYDTRFDAAAVGCAACHGNVKAPAPGGHHERPSPASHAASATDTCTACHARREELTGHFRPGEAFSDHYRLLGAAEPGLYWPDGQARDEVFEAGSLALSRMGHAGVTCLDCHEPHGGGLRAPITNDALCISCHAATAKRGAIAIDRASHGHHPASATVTCVDCHMPHVTVMERDQRRDHRFSSPDPLLARDLGVPNACLACHGDRDHAWSLAAVARAWGPPEQRPAHARTRLLARAANGDGSAVPELVTLLHAEPNASWRAAIVDHLARFLDDAAARNALREALADQAPAPRTAAVRALARVPAAKDALAALRADTDRSVRLAAAWATRSTLPRTGTIHDEVAAWIAAGHDTPAGAMRASELAVVEGRHDEAISWASRAVRWDPSTPTYATLARAYAVAGKNLEASRALAKAREASAKTP